MGELAVEWLGRVPYADALVLQERALEARRSGAAPDRLLLLEHPAVITLGSSARAENLLRDEAALAEAGVELFHVRRGGDVTWHGPGQLVGYLIADVSARGRDVHRFLRELEDALIDALAALEIEARRVEGRTGVFVGRDRKIASIGIGVRHWVSWHGFALNVTTDPDAFAAIVPCGLADVTMTSVARERGGRDADAVALEARTRAAVAEAFRARFGSPRV